MNLRSRSAIVVGGLIACLLLDSCSSGGGQQTGDPLATALRQPYDTHSTDVLIGALAGAGIAVQESEASPAAIKPVTGRTSPLRLSRWQARNLAIDVSAGGGGVLGGDIDRVVAMPPAAPPFSYLLAAWVSTGQSGSARLAHDLMGTSDWVHAPGLVYPMLVVVLFVSEATEQTAKDVVATPGSSPSSTVSPARFAVPSSSVTQLNARLASVVTTPCSAVAGFVDQVLNSIFSALKIDPSQLGGGVVGAVGGWLAGIWNAAVSLAQQAVNAIIKQLTAPVINIIRSGLAALATFTMIASYLRRWQAPVVASPAQTRFAVGSEADVTGTFTVTVNRAGEAEQWPSQLVDCAKVLNVSLPELAATGAPVRWTVTGSPDLITVASPGPPYTGTLDSALSVQLGYATGREADTTGNEIRGQVTVATGVERKELGQLRMLVEGFILDQVPGILQPIVNPVLKYYVDGALRAIDSVADITGKQTLVVVHHGPPRPTPSATASAPPSSSSTGVALIAACPLLSVAALDAVMPGAWRVNSDHGTACGYLQTEGSAASNGGALLYTGGCLEMEHKARMGDPPSLVSGVGDEALFVNNFLYVCKGDRGFALEAYTVATSSRTLEIEKQLAMGILAKF